MIGAIIAVIIATLLLMVLIQILIIRIICNYMAKQNAAAFDYDYLAERIAAENYKRMIWIEQQKANNQGSSSGAPEQPVNME